MRRHVVFRSLTFGRTADQLRERSMIARMRSRFALSQRTNTPGQPT